MRVRVGTIPDDHHPGRHVGGGVGGGGRGRRPYRTVSAIIGTSQLPNTLRRTLVLNSSLTETSSDGNPMRSRQFVPSAAALTVFALLVSVGPSSAQTPSTVFVGVVTVTSPPAALVPPAPDAQVTGPRRSVSCRTYFRGQGKGKRLSKPICRKRAVSAVSSRRTVATISGPPPTFVVPPPPPTFPVASPPPVFVADQRPVFVVTLAVAPVVKKKDNDSDDEKSDTSRKAHGRDNEKAKGNGKKKNKGGSDDD